MVRTILALLTVLCFFPFEGRASEEQYKETIVNRLTTFAIPIETNAPIVGKPVFLIPKNVKLVDSIITTTPGEKFLARLELLLFFEKPGLYNIGPFIFKDKEGHTYSAPPLKAKVLDQENILLPSKGGDKSLPLKFYTINPFPTIYERSFLFFIFEVPKSYEKIEIYWPGWENIYTIISPQINETNNFYEIKTAVFFFKAGKYNLQPLRLAVKYHDYSQFYSSAVLNFDVNALPYETQSLGLGDGIFKPSIYSSTEKSSVQISLVYTGSGNLYELKPPLFHIAPGGDLLLKDRTIELFDFSPNIKGKVSYTYLFLPHQDGTYNLSIESYKLFNAEKSSYKNISSTSLNFNVLLPSNPKSTEYNSTLKEKLNIKSSIDIDFYALITLIFMFTFVIIGLYIRTIKRTKVKKGPKFTYEEDRLLNVQRAILFFLKTFTDRDLTTLPLSQIKDIIIKTTLPDTLKSSLISWLESSYKVRYLKKGSGVKTHSTLIKEGIELLRILKEQKDSIAKKESKNGD